MSAEVSGDALRAPFDGAGQLDFGQALLASAGTLLASSLDVDATLAAVAKLVVPAFADWFVIHVRDEVRGLVPVLTMHWDPARRAFAEEYERRYPADWSGSPAVRVAESGNSELYTDVTDDLLRTAARGDDHLEVIRTLGMRSVMVVPLSARGRRFGAMTLVAAESDRRYSRDDVRIAEELALRVAAALDTARLFAAERAAVERTARLQAVTAGLARALTIAQVAEIVVREGMTALQARDGLLCLTSADGAWLEIVHQVGLPDDTAREFRRFPVFASLPLSDAVRLREPIFFESKTAIQTRYPVLREANQRAATEAWVALPLLSGEAAVGGLAFGFGESRPFAAADRALSLTLAQQCVLAIERARLFESERRARAGAERLQALTASLSGAVTQSAVANSVMRQGVAALGAYAGVIALLRPEDAELELLSSIGYPADACMSPGRRWPLAGAMPIAEAVRTNTPVFVESPEEWGARYLGGKHPKPGKSAAWAAVPFGDGHAAAGALLWTYDRPRAFRSDDRDLMAAVARQCSQALDRARLFESEQVARARADEANRAKTEFLAVMSHELRTPLNAIAGYAELMELGVHGPVTDAQRDALARIQRSGRHLLGLINDVLNFARIEGAHVELAIASVALDERLSVLETLLAPQLEAKHIRYTYERCDGGIRVAADPDKLDQIMLNLLSNAIKFTASGGTITLSCAASADQVTVSVSDSGQGIPADKHERIFEPFFQVDRGTTRAHEGTGLGLAISRELARAMDGDILVESAAGEGSTFRVVLRRA
jgi:signal transduction histidine kinase